MAYDYVIVGAGSAGCVLASRPGESPDASIAVIEAGPPDTDPEIHVPFAFGQLLKSRIDWDFASEPEPASTTAAATCPAAACSAARALSTR